MSNAEKIMDPGSSKSKTTPTSQPMPNNPYSPKGKQVSVAYSASAMIDLTTANSEPLEIYHFGPLSAYSVYSTAAADADLDTLLSGIDFSPGQPAGRLLIELADVSFPSSLTLYFQLADAAIDAPPKPYQFSYLSSDGWKRLTVTSDTTANFSYSGIIQVQLPQNMSTDCVAMPGENYWIAITSDAPTQQAALTYLDAHAVQVSRTLTASLPAGVAPSLASNQINALQTPNPHIAHVLQPFSSFAGIPGENQRQMQRRVCRRLNNKNRAWSPADYEVTALLTMPSLYYSRCLPGNPTVCVVVIPSYENSTLPGVFTPAVNARIIQEIQLALARRAPASADVDVVNFKQQPVKIQACVALKRYDSALQVYERLSRSLKVYLSP